MKKKTINTGIQQRQELENSYNEKLYNLQRKISASIRSQGLRVVQLQLEFLQRSKTITPEGLSIEDVTYCYKAAIKQYINRLKIKEDARRNNN